MSQVFLAYKRPDEGRVAVVREKLEALGVELFIEHKTGAGENYISVINEQLSSALAAVVFWSKAAIAPPPAGQRNFFMSEATRADSRNILIAITLDKVVLDSLPVPFNTYQAANLSDWLEAQDHDKAKHPERQKLLQAIGAKFDRPGLPALARVLVDSVY